MADYLEDVEVGATDSFGSYEVTAAEIVEFGRAYDPQPFHVDEAAAEESMFGELVASGWHTGAMTMRMLVEHYLADAGVLGSPGLDRLRWQEPVRPGDTLHVETEEREVEPWDDEKGVSRTLIETLNQDDEVVMSMVALSLYPRRP